MIRSGFRGVAAVMLVGAVASLPPAVRAASLESEIEMLRSDLKAEKVEIIKETVHVDGATADAFWPLYRRYQLELDQLTDKRLAMIKDYAANYDHLTNEKAKALVKQALDLQSQRVALFKKYYPQFEKVLGSIDAARLLQVEHLMMAMVDVQVGTNMPLAGEKSGK
jgi:ribosomal protein L7/L12